MRSGDSIRSGGVRSPRTSPTQYLAGGGRGGFNESGAFSAIAECLPAKKTRASNDVRRPSGSSCPLRMGSGYS